MFIILVFSLVILGYTYAGYPLIIALLAKWFPLHLEPVSGASPSVSALIPVFNGAKYISQKLDSLLSQEYPADKLEILLCSDGSSDETDKVLSEYESLFPGRVRVFRMEKRSGKPAVLNRLRREANGDVLLMTDIRQPLEKNCLSILTSILAIPSVAVVGGQLILKGRTGAGFYWKYENWIRQSESRFRSVTGVSGALYVVAAKDMEDFPVDIILDDVWVPSLQRLRHRRVVLAPQAIAYDSSLEDRREFGRKIRTLAGNYQLLARLPALLIPFRNPSWFELFSHKVLRLLCPWALIGLFLSNGASIFVSDIGYGSFVWIGLILLFGFQLVFYLAALLGEKVGLLGKLSRTFVLLNIAAIVGLWRYLIGSQKIVW